MAMHKIAKEMNTEDVYKLDKIDREILKILSVNARTKYKDIAKKLGVYDTTIKSRIARMEKEGVITTHSSLINLSKLGLAHGYVTIKLDSVDINDVVKRLLEIDEIVRVNEVLGSYDIFVRLIARNPQDLHSIIFHKINTIPGVNVLGAGLTIEWHLYGTYITPRLIDGLLGD